MSKDWLDSEEFLRQFAETWVHQQSSTETKICCRSLEDLKTKIREHFLPKNQETYDLICDCMETADYGLKEVDFDKLRKLALGEE